MTAMELTKKFPTEEEVIAHYLTIRYPDGVYCNHCGSKKVYQEHKRRKVFSCKGCRSTFSPFKGTIFENSSTDLSKWMFAIHLFLNAKKGFSAMHLQREIGVTYKTAWRMLKLIRLAMGNTKQKEFYNAIVEIDETYIGGKPRRKNNKDNNNNDTGGSSVHTNKRGRGTNKSAVVGVFNRKTQQVFAKVAEPNDVGERLTFKQLMDILGIVSKPDNGNTIMTDEFVGYNSLAKNNYVHLRVNHTKEFSNGNIHTNNIEGFWAMVKRGIYGIYHHISVKYMQRYIDEFCFRFNNRDNDMFDLVLRQSILLA
jgi:transposase-like protein